MCKVSSEVRRWDHLGLQVIVSHMTKVLETELGPLEEPYMFSATEQSLSPSKDASQVPGIHECGLHTAAACRHHHS